MTLSLHTHGTARHGTGDTPRFVSSSNDARLRRDERVLLKARVGVVHTREEKVARDMIDAELVRRVAGGLVHGNGLQLSRAAHAAGADAAGVENVHGLVQREVEE